MTYSTAGERAIHFWRVNSERGRGGCCTRALVEGQGGEYQRHDEFVRIVVWFIVMLGAFVNNKFMISGSNFPVLIKFSSGAGVFGYLLLWRNYSTTT